MLSGEHIDGGQDLVRLAQWTKQENIDTINIDVHGNLKLDTLMPEVFVSNTSDVGKDTNTYLALSVNRYHDTLREYQQGIRIQDYWWLRWKHPDQHIGKSIIIYNPTYEK
jgi:hypothetical protein